MQNYKIAAVVLGGALFALFVACFIGVADQPAGAKEEPAPTVAQLSSEIEALKKLLPDQAHAMSDVGYHFSNLWFAGQAGNWPLAEFYWKETKSHLQWAVRIKPLRQDNAKRTIELTKILESLENGPLKQLGEAIAATDGQKFAAAYKFTVEGCYACHKASDKPYLRPQIPQHPESQMISADISAAWPK
jgi:hypothetical protein